MKYDKIIVVDSALGMPRVIKDVEATTFGELKAVLSSANKELSWHNKAVVIRGSNVSLELDEALLPQHTDLTLFVTNRKSKSGADSYTSDELKAIAKKNKVVGYSKLNKKDLESKLKNLGLLGKTSTKKVESKVTSKKEGNPTADSSFKSTDSRVKSIIEKLQKFEDIIVGIDEIIADLNELVLPAPTPSSGLDNLDRIQSDYKNVASKVK